MVLVSSERTHKRDARQLDETSKPKIFKRGSTLPKEKRSHLRDSKGVKYGSALDSNPQSALDSSHNQVQSTKPNQSGTLLRTNAASSKKEAKKRRAITDHEDSKKHKSSATLSPKVADSSKHSEGSDDISDKQRSILARYTAQKSSSFDGLIDIIKTPDFSAPSLDHESANLVHKDVQDCCDELNPYGSLSQMLHFLSDTRLFPIYTPCVTSVNTLIPDVIVFQEVAIRELNIGSTRLGRGGASNVYPLEASNIVTISNNEYVIKLHTSYNGFRNELIILNHLFGEGKSILLLTGGIMPTVAWINPRSQQEYTDPKFTIDVLMSGQTNVAVDADNHPYFMWKPLGSTEEQVKYYGGLIFYRQKETLDVFLAKKFPGLSQNCKKYCMIIIMYKLLAIITEIHNKHVIHGDLKPSNIYIKIKDESVLLEDGYADEMHKKRLLKLLYDNIFIVVGDFTHSVVRSERKTKASKGGGTPEYRSPELFFGMTEIHNWVDYWSIGVIMTEFCTNSPFLKAFKSVDFRAVRNINDDSGEDKWRIVAQSWNIIWELLGDAFPIWEGVEKLPKYKFFLDAWNEYKGSRSDVPKTIFNFFEEQYGKEAVQLLKHMLDVDPPSRIVYFFNGQPIFHDVPHNCGSPFTLCTL
jgi:hypothetical protein